MVVNLCRASVVASIVALLSVTGAAAAPIPAGTIIAHHVYTRFLPGGYVTPTKQNDDGFAPGDRSMVDGGSAIEDIASSATDEGLAPFADLGFLDATADRGGLSMPTNAFAQHASPALSPVPIPPSLPLFGGAVLGLAALNRARRAKPAVSVRASDLR